MWQVNLSKDFDYHTQINNRIIPFQSCGPTSAIMALLARGISFEYDAEKYPDPADALTMLLLSEKARTFMHEQFPWAEGAGLIPQNLSVCLKWGIDRFVGKTVDHFTTRGTLQDIIWHLCHGRPLIMSGSFTASGHFLTVMGFETLQHQYDLLTIDDIDMDAIVNLVIDDPYGDYHTGYDSKRGNDIAFTVEEFHALTNQPIDGLKWTHVISEERNV